MAKTPEFYKPSTEEIKKAEEMMTDEQREKSEDRSEKFGEIIEGEFLERSNKTIDDYFDAYNSSRYYSETNMQHYYNFPIRKLVQLPENFDKQKPEQVKEVLGEVEDSLMHFDLGIWDEKNEEFLHSEAFTDLMEDKPLNIDKTELEESFVKNKEESIGTEKRHQWSGYNREEDAHFKEQERNRAKSLALLAARFYKIGEKSVSDEALELAKKVAESNPDYYYNKWEPYLPIALAQLVRGESNEESLDKAEKGTMTKLGSWEKDGIMPGSRRNGLVGIAKTRYLSGLPIDSSLKNMSYGSDFRSYYPKLDEHTQKCIELLKETQRLLREQ